jgi:hypothetical protein
MLSAICYHQRNSVTILLSVFFDKPKVRGLVRVRFDFFDFHAIIGHTSET